MYNKKQAKVYSHIKEFISKHELTCGDNVFDRDNFFIANLESKLLVAEIVDIILDTEPK